MAHTDTRYRSKMKQVRGLGSAREGTGHFWLQRVTALALIPLSVWFMIKLVGLLTGGDRTTIGLWFADPVSALLMALLLVMLFVHSRIGIQVIIEDYVHAEGTKIALILLSNGFHLLLGVASLLALVHLHFNGI